MSNSLSNSYLNQYFDIICVDRVMSLSGDSCSTSSGCVSDLDNLSEDPSPDSPISSTDSVHSSTTSAIDAIKSLPNNDLTKALITTETILAAKQTAEDVAEEVDEGLIEEELIDSEIIIDCSPIDAIDSTEQSVQNQVLTDNCFSLEFGARDRVERTESTDCFRSFSTSFDCSSSISSNYSKAETASIKSDISGTSGHESDTRPEPLPLPVARVDKPETKSINSADSTKSVINGIFKEVNNCLNQKSDEINRNCSKTSANSNSSNSYYCKWTHCDWPGNYDDLVDHIREIHVELQPYQQQKHNWNELNSSKTKANAKIATISKPIDRKPTDSQCSSGSNVKKVESTQQYVCLWEGCKVYGKASLSRNWLERHVLEQHSGPRPFKCIVEGCGARFKVQSALERHVNSHFKPSVDFSNSNCSSDVTNTCSCAAGAGPGPSVPLPNNCCANSYSNSCLNSMHGLTPFELHLQQSSRATMSAVRCKTSSVDSTNTHHLCSALTGANGTPNKILKRKKSATKLRRKCLYVKCSEDFFDECAMEQIRYGLIQLNAQTGLDISGNQSTITFHSKVIARRENDSKEVNVLLKWEPIDILPDCWVPEEKVSEMSSKTVPVSTIPADCLAKLMEMNGFERKPKTKQRRK